MKYKLILVLIFILNSFTVKPQNTVGTISLTEDALEGYTLITLHTESYLIDNCGRVINQWSSAFPPGNAVYLLENGNLLRAGRTTSTDITFGGQGGIVELYDWDGHLLWSYLYDTPLHRQHHDVFPMPNGNVLILAAEVMTASEAIQAGRNPNLLINNRLFNEQIVEVEPIGNNNGNIVWEWNVKDHLIQDYDNTKDNFGVVSNNPQLLDINFTNGSDGHSNWLHMNSLQYNHELDQIILSARAISEIFIIDHSTTTAEAATNTGGLYGRGGDFLYRWGNPQSYRQGTETDRQLYGQHFPHWIPSTFDDGGKLILFNNGDTRIPQFSEVFVLDLPESSPGNYEYTAGTSYKPSQPDYIYSNQSEFFSRIVSSAQRLPNGNTLICSGFNGDIFEIDNQENIVWEYISPVNNNNGDIATQGELATNIVNITFRAIKYAKNYPAFIGKDITPGDPIELNPNTDVCDLLAVSETEFNNFKIYPNPTRSELHIKSNKTISRIEVINVLGEVVLANESQNDIQLNNLSSGVYFVKIFNEENSLVKRIIKN